MRGWPSAWRGADGCRLWQQQQFAGGHHSIEVELRCWHSVEHHRVGPRQAAAAGQDLVGPRTTTQAPAARRDFKRSESWPEEWLLIEWPQGEKEPIKYWLSTLPAKISYRDLIDIAKLRWRIERDYQELKQEVGLGHYEGRGWRGFHH